MICNLNVKTIYSVLNSTIKIDDLIEYSLSNKMKYVSICDIGYLSGAIELIVKANRVGLQSIIGLDININHNGRQYHCLLYALNNIGFKNLEKISSIYLLNDNYIEFDSLKDIKNDIIFVFDILKTTIYELFLLEEDALSSLNHLKSLFNEFYYYFVNDFDEEFKAFLINNYDINNQYQIAANPTHYQDAQHYKLYYLLRCLALDKSFDDMLYNQQGDSYLLNESQLSSKYNNKVYDNTKLLLENFKPYTIQEQITLPSYLDTIEKTNEYLNKLCLRGLKRRLNSKEYNVDKYINRLKFELNVVIKMGYSSYFLVVYDYVLYAKKHNIIVGPGRGSSAGSLIAYCLGITDVDPIKNNLIFERFLNPERISLPDIDVDFQDNRREEVIEYLKFKYGAANIAHIITFGTFQAKNSIRDLGKVLNIPVYKIDMILRLIPVVNNVKLSSLIKESGQLQLLLNTNTDLSELYHLAVKAEGIIRHISTHAAGIIITSTDIMNYAPVTKGINDTLMIQYSMDYLEKIGLYKMDILGLKNLGIISDIIDDIDVDFKISDIPLNDPKTLDMMSLGETLGVFQFESSGVIKILQKMKVDDINDLVATTALFRPGPMQFIDEYISRKNKSKSFTYIHESLKDILEPTYGIIVFQEQIMQICQIMAGFSYGKADIVRKGMAKKDETVLMEIKGDFITSSVNNGYSNDVATKVFDMILLFSNYGFNKAHAYSYALLGYYLAYLKANYSNAFFKSVLSANIYSINKIKQYSYEMHRYGLKIVNPNINYSRLNFVNVDNTFIMPFLSIKGIGDVAASQIINERDINGDYKNYLDCLVRLTNVKITETTFKKLIYSGCFDSFEYNRKTMIENLQTVLRYISINTRYDKFESLQLGLVSRPRITRYVEDFDIYKNELELIGLYLSKNPLDEFIDDFFDMNLSNFTSNKKALVAIENIKQIRTKKGLLMAFVTVSDYVINKTLVVFPDVYIKYHDVLKRDSIILVSGNYDVKDSNNIIVKKVEILK